MIKPNVNKGFSLVSLMVATSIGVFIMGAAGTVYVNSKSSFDMRSVVSSTTENGRFALEDMRRTLVMAGRGIRAQDDDPALYKTADNGLRTFPAVGTDGIVDEDGNGNSVVAVRYRGAAAAPLVSCSGLVTDTATVRFMVNDNKELVCEVDGVSQPLVSGIERMNALYGVDDDADGYANRYLTAGQVEAETRWVNVVGVRVGLVARSDDDLLIPPSSRPEQAQTLDVLGADFTAPDTTHLYRSNSVTISFRNLNTTVQRQ